MPKPELSVPEAVEAALHTEDEERRWELVGQLHVGGGREALEAAARLHDHPDPARRRLAADVLSQLGAAPGRAASDGPFREESLALLLAMAHREGDPDVLYSITTGFGHIGDERSLEPLLRLATHADVRVRYGVTFGLLGRTDTAALDALITLSADDDADVRDWATFGLARQTDLDFPGLRDALADRLTDEDVDTRVEALHGLSTRADERATAPLLGLLAAPPEDADLGLLHEALCALAVATADPRLLPYVLAERDGFLDDPVEDWPEDLCAALAGYGEPLPEADPR